ncbi:MAG: Re/Si-specific NAD(P)(+) transhydrogenase subunit alpha [Chromatiales bacterium]|nr:Re/Si-specific NAD(P)(+) transhydrogenase subunit alpha [Chromatiales bacterium]
MKLAVPKERWEGEARVAASPETVKKLIQLGLEVVVETGAGMGASFLDSAYEEAGATIAKTFRATVKDAGIVFKVRPATDQEVSCLKPGANLIGMLEPYDDEDGPARYAAAGVSSFCMEFLPRISRAQSMDVLSSQSNLAGYRAVIDAAAAFTRAMPMMMTAAGTVAPARVLVMGAGVAGLQAIATARRLGAIVNATDVRRAAKEQVESLGAKFVMVESEETANAETAGGYAREMSDEYKQAQAALIAQTLAKQDIVICTALIPGRPAPMLIDDAMVASMRPGSIIVDLAVERGGNCAGSEAGKAVEVNGVKILGYLNMAGRLAVDASALYAKNLLAFLTPLVTAEGDSLNVDWNDEIISATALTHDNDIVHPLFAKKDISGDAA